MAWNELESPLHNVRAARAVVVNVMPLLATERSEFMEAQELSFLL